MPPSTWRAGATADPPRGYPQTQLLANAEFLNNRLVSLGVVFLQVVQQAPPLADQHEQTAPGGVIFLVRLKVFRQLANPLAQQCYLDFRAPRVRSMRAILVNEGSLMLSG